MIKGVKVFPFPFWKIIFFLWLVSLKTDEFQAWFWLIFGYAIFRPTFEIYIGNYPVEFDENDVRNLFNENGVPVTTIRLKKNGQNV